MKAFSVTLMLCKHLVLGENCLCTHSCLPGRVMGTNCVLLFFPNVKKAVQGSQRRTPDAVNAKTSLSLRLFWSSILMFGIWKLTIQLYLFAIGCMYSNSRMTQSLTNYSLCICAINIKHTNPHFIMQGETDILHFEVQNIHFE